MDGMNTTAMAKRHGEFNHWEPIYIGTNNVSFKNMIMLSSNKEVCNL